MPEGGPKEEKNSKGTSQTKRPRTQDGATYRLGTLEGRTLNTSRERGRSGTFLREVVGGGGGKTRAHDLGGDARPLSLPKSIDVGGLEISVVQIKDVFLLSQYVDQCRSRGHLVVQARIEPSIQSNKPVIRNCKIRLKRKISNMWSFKQTAPIELFAVSEEWKMLFGKINSVQEEVMLSLSEEEDTGRLSNCICPVCEKPTGKWAREDSRAEYANTMTASGDDLNWVWRRQLAWGVRKSILSRGSDGSCPDVR